MASGAFAGASTPKGTPPRTARLVDGIPRLRLGPAPLPVAPHGGAARRGRPAGVLAGAVPARRGAGAGPAKGVEGEEGENGEEKKKEEKSSKSNVELQREWLQINLVRTLTTDLGAWVCAFVAAVKTFS
ncbi:hypothetical protein ACCO45_008005 [Purpureocillium lilacinum]|uniref:Uncharacterized protein n=1 Tax=Purpureocillium lilacinum TaxID=33203 RepID=A0ACC4DM19_PURLI